MEKVKIGINGFGRIGRLAFRVLTMHHSEYAEIVAINTSGSMPASGWKHLIKYDTTYKRYPFPIEAEDLMKKPKKEATDENPLIGYITAKNVKYPILAQRNPAKIPWEKYGADIIIESTGVFVNSEGAQGHLDAGAKKVIISAPGKSDDIKTYVRGVNQVGDGNIISNASCTTNCIAPVASVIHQKFGIVKATMSTIHGYTDGQRLQDNSHKDLHRARAAALNIVPTTTGAAKATALVIPELKGIFDGIAIRVPVPTGSLVEFVFVTKQKTTVEEVNKALIDAAQSEQFAGILNTTDEPIVSSDVIGEPYSAIVDLNFTQVIDGDLVKVLAWYDNEWGYTNRLVEQTIQAAMLPDAPSSETTSE